MHSLPVAAAPCLAAALQAMQPPPDPTGHHLGRHIGRDGGRPREQFPNVEADTGTATQRQRLVAHSPRRQRERIVGPAPQLANNARPQPSQRATHRIPVPVRRVRTRRRRRRPVDPPRIFDARRHVKAQITNPHEPQTALRPARPYRPQRLRPTKPVLGQLRRPRHHTRPNTPSDALADLRELGNVQRHESDNTAGTKIRERCSERFRFSLAETGR